MPKLRFQGRIHPEHIGVNVKNLPRIDFHEPPSVPHLPQGLNLTYVITISNSHIDMEVDVQPWNDDTWPWVFNRVGMTARALIDLYSFGTGAAFVVLLDTVTLPDGTEKKLLIIDPKLGSLCTVLSPVSPTGDVLDVNRALLLILQEPEISLVLRDLISGVTYPNMAVIDCARAVEGIRHIIDPRVSKRGQGWAKLQEVLNVEQSYRELITSTSANPRHGAKAFIAGDVVTEIVSRSWTIMNRFIEYKIRGAQKLSVIDFPVLI